MVTIQPKSVLEVIKAIPQQPQVQYDLQRQLEELRVAANKLGLYDAADFLRPINPNQRKYIKDINLCGGIPYTLEQFNEAVDEGYITDDDGIGHWVKDGFESRDDVFNSLPLDATHVMWYNK
jgi:hypothetical protein